MRYQKQILNVLAVKRHLRVEEIFHALKREHSFVSIATVYRNIKRLESKSEVTGFLHPDGTIRYELHSTDPHSHLVCEKCGVVIEVKFGFVEELSQNLAQRARFHIHPHRLTMVGRCSQCKVQT